MNDITELKIRRLLAETFATGIDKISVMEIVHLHNVCVEDVHTVALSTMPDNDLQVIDGDEYIMKSWMKSGRFFKTCERCGREIATRDNRTPFHCVKCGIETGTIKQKLEGKWKHHLNIKQLCALYNKYGKDHIYRSVLLEYNQQMWGYNTAVDDFMYYLIRAKLVTRIRPGEYMISNTGVAIATGKLQRSSIITEQVEREYTIMKEHLKNGEYMSVEMT